MSAIPTCLQLQPIDGAAKDGNYCLLFAGRDFALGRWRHGAWRFGNGRPLPFEPESYQPRRVPEPAHG